MKTTKEKILIISDDFDNFYRIDDELKKISKEYNCNIELTNTFKNVKVKKYNVLFIDYGLITEDGEEELAIPLLREANYYNLKIIWMGVYGKKYNEDCKQVFPKLKFLHNLKGISIENIEYGIPAVLNYF